MDSTRLENTIEGLGLVIVVTNDVHWCESRTVASRSAITSYPCSEAIKPLVKVDCLSVAVRYASRGSSAEQKLVQ